MNEPSPEQTKQLEDLFQDAFTVPSESEDTKPIPAKPTSDEIARSLEQQYDGVIVILLERDKRNDLAEMTYSTRGGFYQTLGMLDRLRHLMLQDEGEE